MKLHLLSNHSQLAMEYLEGLKRSLPFVLFSLSSQLVEEVDLLIVFPDQKTESNWHLKLKEQSNKSWIICLDDGFSEAERCQLLADGVHLFFPVTLSQSELSLRLLAIFQLIKQYQLPHQISFNQNELVLYTQTQQVFLAGTELRLTGSEYQLLVQFMQFPNRIYSRDELLLLLNNQRGMHRSIDTHIKNLRKKLTLEHQEYPYIQTIHGRGYRFQGLTQESHN